MFKSKITYTFLLCLAYSFALSQGSINHLLAELKASENPKNKVDLKSSLFLAYYMDGNIKLGRKYYEEALAEATKIEYKRGLAGIYNNYGTYLFNSNLFDSALVYYQKSREFGLKAKDKEFSIKPLNNIASLRYMNGDYKEALEIYTGAMRAEDSLGIKEGTYVSLNNIGAIYIELAIFEEAHKIFLKAEKIYSTKEKKGSLLYTYDGLSETSLKLNRYDSAIYYGHKALDLCLELDDKFELGYICANLGSVYCRTGNYEKGIELFNIALKHYKNTDDYRLGMSIYTHLAEAYEKTNKLKEADACFEQMMLLEKRFNIAADKKNFYRIFAELSFRRKEYKNAYLYLNEYIISRDSSYTIEVTQQLTELRTRYETDKKDKENALLQKDKDKAESDLNNQRTVRNYLIILIVLFVFILIGAFLGFKKIKRINAQLESNNAVIQQKNHLLEEQKKEIVDSITYAKRIQSAILAPQRIVKQYLPNSFILYKPKDIVAGDFYWLENIGDTVLFAAADCTGHGVPGAMVSVVCNNGLNRSVREYGLTDPGKILDKTRDIIIQEFEKSDEEVKDGMDISLCALNTKTKTIKWAGANNPIWIIRKNGDLEEIKANKQPIGKYAESQPFTTHTINLQEGDTIYVFTDGYQDQFGGEKGKKYKASRLKELLLSLQSNEMGQQYLHINQSFEEWKGNLEQVDDVCIIGVRV